MPIIIRNGRVYGSKPIVDTELSLVSKNAVENRAIANAIKEIKDSEVPHWIGTSAELEVALASGDIEDGTIILVTDSDDIDELPTEDSLNLVYSGGVWLALQEKENLFRYATMPEPVEELEGVITEYIGNTTVNYTNGFFYKCVEVSGSSPIEYIWEQTNVQPIPEASEIVPTAYAIATADISSLTAADEGKVLYVYDALTADDKIQIVVVDSETSAVSTENFAGTFNKVSLTQVQYDALTVAEKAADIEWWISDEAKIMLKGVSYGGVSDLHVVADEFDDTVAYAVGDYCLYDGDLYVCTTAHAAGTWDANDFTATNVTEELKKKTEYKEFVGTVAEFNALTLAEKLSYNMANFTDD